MTALTLEQVLRDLFGYQVPAHMLPGTTIVVSPLIYI